VPWRSPDIAREGVEAAVQHRLVALDALEVKLDGGTERVPHIGDVHQPAKVFDPDADGIGVGVDDGQRSRRRVLFGNSSLRFSHKSATLST